MKRTFSNRPWSPNIDTSVSELGEFVIEVELSGLRKTDLEIAVVGHAIQITGTRSPPAGAEAADYLRNEIHRGPFDVSVDIPEEYDLGSAKAAYQNGFLRIVIPAREFTLRCRRVRY